MQTIYLKKFGNVLVSRPAGLEAFKAIRQTLDPREPIQINFEDTFTITPGWFDEFLTNLTEYAEGDVVLLPTKNASVLASLPVLITGRHDKFAEVVKRFLESNK
ncbi:MAG: hypothetical protein FJY98_01495 [Candidatus Liptonbacteria bacterium]|nr:hypothetical protein [Candidatus Liptonbacteria bacterium]